MKVAYKVKLISLLLAVVLMVIPAVAMAAQPTVNLGTTSTFAVLAGSAITNTGETTIKGDIGLYPGTSFSGEADATIDGEVHLTDDVAEKAKEDLVVAYNDAAGRSPVTTISTELGGQTLTPGVYNSASGTFEITGILTLDAQGDPEAAFIFLAASTLVTATDSNIDLINGAHFCRIFWQVGTSATLGVTSHFVGHILAMDSITVTTGATVQGQLLARNGAVTLDNNTIINDVCEFATSPSDNESTAPEVDTTQEIPTGTLPVTSGFPAMALYTLGALLTATGVFLKRKSK